MSDKIIKKENPDDDGSDDDPAFPEITKLLEEVKREEAVSFNAETAEAEPLSESFFDDLYRAECEENSAASVGNLAKRKRKNIDELTLSSSTTPTSSKISQTPHTTPLLASHSQSQLQSSSLDENAAENEEAPVTEKEMEDLLKAEDYNSGEEPDSSDKGMTLPSNALPYGFPTEFHYSAPMCGPSQDMGNLLPVNYPPMYNMGMPPFYPANMGHMQMMGYGFPQVNINDQNEVQCLPVINSAGFAGMPSFKRIKLERSSNASSEEVKTCDESAENRRKKVVEACTALLEKLEFDEPTGKFTYTSTVTKLKTPTSNSIVQKISNVTYNFHSIGPKLILADWGLREIANSNAGIAKKISMSADVYFAKIAEKENTVARKLIKVENGKADNTQEEFEMETEEPTLSSFLKNTMTQTDAQVCRECAKRKRIVGHDIGVQATAYTGSVGSQTSPLVNDDACLSGGLSSNQLKAMYKFSSLIREPSKCTPVEMIRLRESLIEIYNLSQQRSMGPIHNVSLFDSSPRPPQEQNYTPANDFRTENRSNHDPRKFATPGMPIPTHMPYAAHSRNLESHIPSQPQPMYQPIVTQTRHYPMLENERNQPFVPPVRGYPMQQNERQYYGRGGQRR